MRRRWSRRATVLMALAMGTSLVACTTSSPTSSVQPGLPSPSPSQVVAASPLPTPTALPTLAPARPKPAAKPVQPALPLAWSVQVRLFTYSPTLYSVAVIVVDAGGRRLPASYRLNLTRVVNPPPVCLSSPCPKPPTTWVDGSSGCCTPESISLNINWGGTWSIRGSVTYRGVTKSVSGSGAIRYP